jgi:hypothetical protein
MHGKVMKYRAETAGDIGPGRIMVIRNEHTNTLIYLPSLLQDGSRWSVQT